MSTYSIVGDFLSGSGWQPLSATPGTLVHILESFPRFQEGMVLTDGMGLGTLYSSSECLLSRIPLCCRKLDLFSLPLVGWFMRSCIGWSWSLLNFAACVYSIFKGKNLACIISLKKSVSLYSDIYLPIFSNLV